LPATKEMYVPSRETLLAGLDPNGFLKKNTRVAPKKVDFVCRITIVSTKSLSENAIAVLDDNIKSLS
jgi:hypothetical protein